MNINHINKKNSGRTHKEAIFNNNNNNNDDNDDDDDNDNDNIANLGMDQLTTKENIFHQNQLLQKKTCSRDQLSSSLLLIYNMRTTHSTN
jgi:hypothetical protein